MWSRKQLRLPPEGLDALNVHSKAAWQRAWHVADKGVHYGVEAQVMADDRAMGDIADGLEARR